MIRIFGTIFAGLFGLAFGSFLNVCLSRWPEDESIVHPRSHCRNCTHTLAWWENVPLISWLALRGRCRNCHTWISLRYPLVELAVGVLWSGVMWQILPAAMSPGLELAQVASLVVDGLGQLTLYWLLVALAIFDAENLWLPDKLTLGGAAFGFVIFLLQIKLNADTILRFYGAENLMGRFLSHAAMQRFLGILASAALILLIRWLYKLIRHREGIGLGDAKLMGLLAAWLGLPGALLAFALGVFLGALAALVLLALPKPKTQSESWSLTKLPLGTFLCIGGIISSLWGQPMIFAYLHWSGFKLF